ncbi:glycerate kinase [Spirosoma rhododendri]|uniref:Glycerate kinase n=1 Tax=Spirosoma rhododendri TaxID=2728024 RepID=A0A7L5DL43_9BACT|nr:glycerate kinase [Spirosoma rhododendri]QJD77138.1 glycerate kinase [Spirosoma rhododendri]
MRIILAPDKFRGSLSARKAARAMAEGVRLALPDAELIRLPLADGGEGTACVLTRATGGSWHAVDVQDPLGRTIEAGFGLAGDGKTAFIDMASASGLILLAPDERNPLNTSTYGTGQLISRAMETGVKHIVLGIGGSATTDAGVGMAAALGWQLLDEYDAELPPVGGSLNRLARLVPPTNSPVDDVWFSVACDVLNPLYGPEGAAYVYGPQKGATPAQVEQLDAGLQQFAQVIREQFGYELGNVPGAGAAGGLGAGCLFFLQAGLRPGSELVLDTIGFDQHLIGTDLILTGEGKLDSQTAQGKLLHGLTSRAGDVPVVAICGSVDLSPEAIDDLGLRAAFSIQTQPQSIDVALQTAYDDLRTATFNVCRLFSK